MMRHGFICASANIEELEPEAEGMPVVRALQDKVALNCVISNSFGFGGTNATLAFTRHEG
jgi:3-oxoacyl-[acyl-carrier-protein] synthase-1